MKVTSILYVEDEDSIKKELGSFLQRFCETLYTASDGKVGLELFHQYKPDIVISDIKMPNMNGIEMAKIIKDIDAEKPIIFTTAHSESDYTLEAIDMQVDGYILKPIQLKKLQTKLNFIIKQLNLKEELIKQQKLLQVMAYSDSLTGIYNRQRFNEELQKEINRYKRTSEPLSIVMFDIDYFKKFNDTYGHQVGDQILVQITALISKYIREVDTFARWGGEEFILLLPNTDKERGYHVADSLRERIERYDFVNKCKITASFGIVSIDKNDNAYSIEKRVDDALYRAKENGRNRVEG